MAVSVLRRRLDDEAATRAFGAALGRALRVAAPPHVFVTLGGDLGAGKTTLARGLLGALGVTGTVRSPTYTLLESYATPGHPVHHLDWYRLGGYEDLEGLGFRDLQGPPHWLLVEWPERVPQVASTADLAVALAPAPGGLAAGRRVELAAGTATGAAVVAALGADSSLD